MTMLSLTKKQIIPFKGDDVDFPKGYGEFNFLEVLVDYSSIEAIEDKGIEIQIGDKKGRTEIWFKNGEHLLVIEKIEVIKKIIEENNIGG